MEINAVAGAAMMMQSSQTQQMLSASMVKMNAESQDKTADMLAKSAEQASKSSKDSRYMFSTYA